MPAGSRSLNEEKLVAAVHRARRCVVVHHGAAIRRTRYQSSDDGGCRRQAGHLVRQYGSALNIS